MRAETAAKLAKHMIVVQRQQIDQLIAKVYATTLRIVNTKYVVRSHWDEWFVKFRLIHRPFKNPFTLADLQDYFKKLICQDNGLPILYDPVTYIVNPEWRKANTIFKVITPLQTLLDTSVKRDPTSIIAIDDVTNEFLMSPIHTLKDDGEHRAWMFRHVIASPVHIPQPIFKSFLDPNTH